MKTLTDLWALWKADTGWAHYTKRQKRAATLFGFSAAAVAVTASGTSLLVMAALGASLISLALSLSLLLKSGININE